jgi:hypothetical protein
MFDDALDGAILAAAITPLEYHQDAVAMGNDLLLQFDPFDLQSTQGVLVFLVGRQGGVGRELGFV